MIRRIGISLAACLVFNCCFTQELPASTEQQLENLTDAGQSETEDDSYLQQLSQYKKNPINLNTVDVSELRLLRLLTDLQIDNLLRYRNAFGKLISVYELQAVPAWDIITIRKMIPFITIGDNKVELAELKPRFAGGENSILLRVSQVLEKAKGFDGSSGGTKYLGSPQKIFVRYRYSYKNLLQYGIAADKDAGEQFFKGVQKTGFDFYSAHLFVRKLGFIKALAIGDFTVNLGQGLIQWQSLAFKKSVDIMGVKRQSTVLRPYNSPGEFYFNRGAGITVAKGRVAATVFASVRKLSGNFINDTIRQEDFVSSILNSGYHRTSSENFDRNNFTQTSVGGNFTYSGNQWKLGLNAVQYQFSLPLQKRDEPYNLFAIGGKSWGNASVDYCYTYKNLHFFGEAAIDKRMNKAFVNGLLISADQRVDISFLYRSINAGYQSLYGNAFTENTLPVNESGIYTGISIRPAYNWRIDAYADVYTFPWLKYQVDAPSAGKDFLVQLTYSPNKYCEISTRFRNETKQQNFTGNNTVTNYLTTIPRQSWRNQLTYAINKDITVRTRAEVLWYNKKNNSQSDGFLLYQDFMYKPTFRPFSIVMRLQYFETDNYDSRIYAYENDVLYGYSIPAFFGKGVRYYVTAKYEINRKLSCWLRWAQTIFQDQASIGSGLDEIDGNKKSELRFQLIFGF